MGFMIVKKKITSMSNMQKITCLGKVGIPGSKVYIDKRQPFSKIKDILNAPPPLKNILGHFKVVLILLNYIMIKKYISSRCEIYSPITNISIVIFTIDI